MAVARTSEPRGLLLVDLGSRTVRALIAVAADSGLRPRAVATRPYTAGRDGVPVDRALAREQMHTVMREAEQKAGIDAGLRVAKHDAGDPTHGRGSLAAANGTPGGTVRFRVEAYRCAPRYAPGPCRPAHPR